MITIKDIEMGGYSKKQFIALIKLKKELEKYWEGRRQVALKKSNEVLKVLKKN